MRKLEAFCDAVAAYHHYWEPESEAYTLRNPGMLIAGQKEVPQTKEGIRIFSCHFGGYRAFLHEVEKHCKLHPNEQFNHLMVRFGVKMPLQQEHAIDFMQRSLNSNGISLETSLDWFKE